MFKKIFVLISYVSIALLTLAILTLTFDDNALITDTNAASGELVNYSECLIPGDTSFSFGHTSSEDCIIYKYDSTGTLYLTHINSGFSICPGELTADITISDNSILIEERESETGCLEMCLYNLEYVIRNLSSGTYNIKIVSPYPASNNPLEFTVELSEQSNGSFTINRHQYPWTI